MSRFKSFDSTGIAPNGRLYAGDVNAIQDRYADLLGNFAQTVDLGVLRVGETGLQLLRYGAGEARLTGAFRTDGIVRALGGLYGGAFTTTQRDAIGAGFRPYGLVILNSTTNQYEWNSGSDAVPSWKPLGIDPTLVFNFIGTDSELTFRNEDDPENPIIRAAVLQEAVDRLVLRAGGAIEWGPGGATARDVRLERTAAGILKITLGGFRAQSNIRARDGGGAQTEIGDVGPGNKAGILFASDAGIFRDAAGDMRTVGLLRIGEAGTPVPLVPGVMTQVQRDALAAGKAPEGAVIFNTDSRQYEGNVGTDGARLWAPISDPVGSLMHWPYAFGEAPASYERCDGGEVSRTGVTARLHAIAQASGYPDGAGNGTSTFNKPDYRGRALVGVDNMGTGAGNRLTTATLGATGGAATRTLVEANLPPHEHLFTHYFEAVTGNYSGSPSGATVVSHTTMGNFAAIASYGPGTDAYGRRFGVLGGPGQTSTPVDIQQPWKACHILIRVR